MYILGVFYVFYVYFYVYLCDVYPLLCGLLFFIL